MGVINQVVDFAATLVQIPTLLKLKKGMQPRPLNVRDCYGLRVEQNAANLANHIAVIFEGRQVTWAELNALANQYAAFLTAQGLKRGDVVSMMMDNRIEFVAALVALNKLGIIGGLLNTNLTGRPLTHCISVTGSKKCLVGAESVDAITGVLNNLDLQAGGDFLFVADNDATECPDWAVNMTSACESLPTDNPAATVAATLGDVALYIYTSGTTGLPKAAVISNRRYLMSADMSGQAGLNTKPGDRIYLSLPLYHGTGLLIGAGSAFATGATMYIRRKFSASSFLDEIIDNRCTHMVYIGELCRYLMNTPKTAKDASIPLHSIMGNGLRPDVWMPFKERFGIKRVCEFYGASEGNVAFANLMNKNQTVGMTTSEVKLVAYNVDADEVVRDNAGRCIEVPPGEAGLLLCKITPETVFEGYTDQEATEKKIFRGAIEDGDAWFNTGDLMRTVPAGFTLNNPHYQFVDRVGDTFRWKSENVSTNEVGEIINGFDQIKFSNVYGVEMPNCDGRAGMAAVTLQDGVSELDLDRFAEYLQKELPRYAIPVFIRVQPDIDVTGTFKMLKGDLRKIGYDTAATDDPIFVMKVGTERYTSLDKDYQAQIKQGTAGY